MSDIHTMPLKTSAEMLAKKLYEIEDFAREALQSRPGAVGEDWAYLMNALADVKKICADELGEYRTPKAVLDPSAPPCTPPCRTPHPSAGHRGTHAAPEADRLRGPRA